MIVFQHEYMSYMEKKTTKRQTTIITLSDHNKQEIRNIQLQREIMDEEFSDQEKSESPSSLVLCLVSGVMSLMYILNFHRSEKCGYKTRIS